MTATLCFAHKRYLRLHGLGWCFTPLALAALTLVPRAGAQRVTVTPLVTLGGETDERVRLSQLLGQSASNGYLIRSASSQSSVFSGSDSASWRAGLVAPEVRAIHNSGLPFSLNDGPLWAGRGWSQEITAGLLLQAGRIRLIAAPTLVSEDNEIFQVIPYPQNVARPRNVWANPFHPLPESIDLPIRFGDKRHRRLDPGQSSLTIDAGLVSAGAATENLWWGPGIRNAITLSNNAAGFPHLFVRSNGPVHTRAGIFDAQWILGQLSESGFFYQTSTHAKRSLSGLVATWSPLSDSGLTLGVSRLVMGSQSGTGFPLGSAFDVLRTVGHPFTDTTTPPRTTGRYDQLFSLFARWVLPPSGFEAYVEWARFEEPLSLTDLLEYPGHSEGYTLGLEWAHPLAARHTFQLQSEVSYLEPDPSLRLRPVATTYTSRAVPEGFTQRGQTLGAAIGPGSSSQWLAADVFAPRWRIGSYLNRIRWDNGVLFEPIVPQFKRQDVTLLAGLRGGVSWSGVNLLVDFAHAARFNYLYQAYTLAPLRTGGIDLINNTVSVTLSTAVGRR